MAETKAERNLNAVAIAIGIPLAVLLLIWTGWITVTAFIGGQAPWFFIEFDGFSLVRGLLWLLIIDPIVLTVAYWIFMLVIMPIGAAASAIGQRQDRKDAGSQSGDDIA